MVEVFLNIKIIRVIPEGTRIFFTFRVSQIQVSTRKKILSSGLSFRVLDVRPFMYCLVKTTSPAFSFGIKIKQRSNGAFASPAILYSIMPVYMIR